MKLKKGFTLIELLVVVAIIGVLATIVMASLNSARVKARDTRRDADIQTIQTALEMYYLDNGRYPPSGGSVAPGSYAANSGDSSWVALEQTMGVTLPRDPVNLSPTTAEDWAGGINKGLNYAYRGHVTNCPSGQSYWLVYRHEAGDTSYQDSPGVKRCDSMQIKYSNGSITVGVSPAQ